MTFRFAPRLLLLLCALLPGAAMAAAAPVAGTDYTENKDARPLAPLGGKIEVAEVFGYTCPHCADFEPLLEKWKRKQPADVRVTAVPAVFGGYWDAYARVFYAAEALGVLNRTHIATFNALHKERSLPVQNVSANELADFFARQGVDRARFLATLQSAEVQRKMDQSDEFARRAGIPGTPTMVVNGKYTVSVDNRGFDHMLRTVDWLVARERAAAGSKPGK